ncbi:MAG: antibiotic biosynthesis monooxygenase [Peptococcaceae bacterium]|nr:antibiotic biosynthesis monooxygenase [Peptococcaceae bacterium]
MEELTLTIVYTTKPGMRQAFIDDIVKEGLLDKIRAEEGCIAYDYYASEDDIDRLMLIEKWQSAAHQEIHLTQPHMDTLRLIKERYIVQTEII